MKDKDCIFCLLAGGDIPTAKVYEDEKFTVILDANPASRGHALVLPKDHYRDVTEAPAEVVGAAFALGARIGQAMKMTLGASGFNLLANTGEAAGQTVMHMHVHVIPRYEGGETMLSWDPKEADPDQNALIAKLISAAL